jgi:hypothetical protein
MQISIYSDIDYLDTSFRMYIEENGSSSINGNFSYIIPYAKQIKTYGYSVLAENDGVGWLDLNFNNSTGNIVTLWIGDIIFTQDITELPNFLSAIPATGTWIKGNIFPKSNSNGGFVCTQSGTFKTITPATCNVDGTTRDITLVTGNINDFIIGDFIQIGVIGNPVQRIFDINYQTNIITIGNALTYSGSGVALTIFNPVFNTY